MRKVWKKHSVQGRNGLRQTNQPLWLVIRMILRYTGKIIKLPSTFSIFILLQICISFWSNCPVLPDWTYCCRDKCCGWPRISWPASCSSSQGLINNFFQLFSLLLQEHTQSSNLMLSKSQEDISPFLSHSSSLSRSFRRRKDSYWSKMSFLPK